MVATANIANAVDVGGVRFLEDHAQILRMNPFVFVSHLEHENCTVAVVLLFFCLKTDEEALSEVPASSVRLVWRNSARYSSAGPLKSSAHATFPGQGSKSVAGILCSWS